VLETKQFRRVGGVKELPTDFRLVSATNRPLEELVAREAFRGDLFYRINAVVLDLPPLRERVGDIGLLARRFLAAGGHHGNHEDPWQIDDEAMALLEGYAWPGNIRELKNVIERARLLARGRTIRAADLGAQLLAAPASSVPKPGTGLPALDLVALERMAIERALERTSWHQGLAAELLGISPRTLHRKIRALGLTRPR
jgi:DNA-binding NtrC family response regulator